jgi:hypothetical protein
MAYRSPAGPRPTVSGAVRVASKRNRRRGDRRWRRRRRTWGFRVPTSPTSRAGQIRAFISEAGIAEGLPWKKSAS